MRHRIRVRVCSPVYSVREEKRGERNREREKKERKKKRRMKLDSWKGLCSHLTVFPNVSPTWLFYMTILIVELATSVNYRVSSELYIRIAIEYDSFYHKRWMYKHISGLN